MKLMPLYEFQCLACDNINTHWEPLDGQVMTPLGGVRKVLCIFCEELTDARRWLSTPRKPPMTKETREGKWKDEDNKIKQAKRVIEKQRAAGHRPPFGQDEGYSLNDVRKGRAPEI